MHSIHRLRSDGLPGTGMQAFTKCLLSEIQVAEPSSSQPLSIVAIVYHVREKKSNVFVTKIAAFLFLFLCNIAKSGLSAIFY